ncbi:MAG TPA: S8 family serine peptidase, partial [Blastocatellia bacterium]|nr:S8 family serine peptidase [Blastocatellia bacterium]
NAVAYDDSAFEYHGTLTTSVAVGRNFGANGSGALPGIPNRSTGDGVAPDAKIVFQDVGHPSGQLPGVDTVSQALIHQQAYSSGARVHNNSYGPAPPAIYDQDAADIDDIMWRLRDYTIFYSAGNNSPGDFQVTNSAKNNIVVGACDSPTGGGSLENLAGYSNHGPTFDGRIKPDIVAPGTVIGATEDPDDAKSSTYNDNSTSATAKDAAVNPTDPNNDSELVETAVSGTSFSSAMAAGSALLVRQYFTDGFYPSGSRVANNSFTPSNALVKATILNSGRNLTGRFTGGNFPISASGALPNSGQGWGRVALDDALYFAGDRREMRVLADIYNGATAAESNRPAPNAAITTGETHTYQIAQVSNIEPLRITLAWSDPRAAVGSVVALVNNLDLEVVDPVGNVYRGNVNFTNSWSQPAPGAAFDARNPIEGVYVQNPIPGTYTVRVIGANVPGNGQTQILAQPGDQRIDSNRQGYALIATGNFTAGLQPALNLAASDSNGGINGGVNADPFVSKNETVTANVTINNPSSLTAQNVSVRIEVDPFSQVPASVIRVNGQADAAAVNIGDVVAGASKQATFQITLLDDGVDRPGQSLNFKITMTPANGLPFVAQFSTLAQLKLVTYRTRFEPGSDPGGVGVIVVPESDWKKRKDHENRADEDDFFDGDWTLTTAQRADAGGSTASLSDPSGAGRGYGVGQVSRGDGQVFDDSRWWTPKLPIPGLFVTESTGLISNPADAANLKAEIDSFEMDVKADFTGDVAQSATSGDLFILRMRAYNNTVSIRSTDDSGATDASFTNLLHLDAQNVAGPGFIHYSGRNFASGGGVFNVDDEDEDQSDVFFRFELQFRRNGFQQSGEGVFVDNLVVRLRVADTAVYDSPTAGALTTVDAASFVRAASPGQIVAAFGSGFPAGTQMSVHAPSTPLPTDLANVSVRVNGRFAPLFFVGAPGDGSFQINYQMPFETAAGTALVEVLRENRLVVSEYLATSATAPGVFTFNSTGQGQAVALNQDFTLNGPPGGNLGARPESRGRFIIAFANGQGRQLKDAMTGELLTLPSGFPATGILYLTSVNPTVTIGGVNAEVGFSGLAPGFVGLWQLNVKIPDNAPTGNAVPLVISLGDKTSGATTIAIN